MFSKVDDASISFAGHPQNNTRLRSCKSQVFHGKHLCLDGLVLGGHGINREYEGDGGEMGRRTGLEGARTFQKEKKNKQTTTTTTKNKTNEIK